MSNQDVNRVIDLAVTVEAPLAEVWAAWTTEAGIRTFFAPAFKVELRVDGPYEMYFFPEAEPGLRGGEGVRLLAIQPEKMLSFTWNAPTDFPSVRQQRTHVVVRFKAAGDNQTEVNLRHDGWGEGDEWDRAFTYFISAWGEVVLPRLQYRFREGPVDWADPPRFGSG